MRGGRLDLSHQGKKVFVDDMDTHLAGWEEDGGLCGAGQGWGDEPGEVVQELHDELAEAG